MFCTNCGAKLEEDAKFCIYCGQPIEKGTQTAAPQVAPQEPQTQDVPTAETIAQPAMTAEPASQTTETAEPTPQATLTVEPAPPVKQSVQTQEPLPVSREESAWEPDESEEIIPLARRLLPLWIGLGTVALAAVAFVVIQFLPIGEQPQAAPEDDRAAAASSSAVSSEPETEEAPKTTEDDKTQDTTADTEEPAIIADEKPVEEFAPSSVVTDEIIAQGGKYINHRFDYTLAVPEGFVASRETQNGDGIQLYNAEQDMRVIVYGGYQTSKTTEELYDRARAEIPGTLGYTACGNDWYAVSSEDEQGRVHYRKYGAWDDKYRVMELVYPKANEDVCDQLTEELEDGFVSGTSDG
ncbi:MAG: zinc-ribbon domain-containing protein [Butyricicoccus sp.]|nr:zinc-ribbon domain-containing protein [Butyricicoccus sp.]